MDDPFVRCKLLLAVFLCILAALRIDDGAQHQLARERSNHVLRACYSRSDEMLVHVSYA